MLQHYRKDLIKFHELFSGGRCEAWAQEELIIRAIKSDTSKNHSVKWTEKGHDDKADAVIVLNRQRHAIQIKSGKIRNDVLEISGHRLGRFEGNLDSITSYLNSMTSTIFSVSYERNEQEGLIHHYCLRYIDINHLTGLNSDCWEAIKKKSKRGISKYIQTNMHNVETRIHPSMSWQVWWKVPLSLTVSEEPFIIT